MVRTLKDKLPLAIGMALFSAFSIALFLSSFFAVAVEKPCKHCPSLPAAAGEVEPCAEAEHLSGRCACGFGCACNRCKPCTLRHYPAASPQSAPFSVICTYCQRLLTVNPPQGTGDTAPAPE